MIKRLLPVIRNCTASTSQLQQSYTPHYYTTYKLYRYLSTQIAQSTPKHNNTKPNNTTQQRNESSSTSNNSNSNNNNIKNNTNNNNITTTTTASTEALNASPLATIVGQDMSSIDDDNDVSSSNLFTNRNTPTFNTYQLMKSLQRTGITEQQSELLMNCLITAINDAMSNANNNLSTKSDLSALKVNLTEKLFNATLKHEFQQKHLREITKSDMDSLRNDTLSHHKNIESDFKIFSSDMRMTLKTELFQIQQHINRLEKELETEKKTFILAQDQLENKLIKYALGFIASFGALTLTAIRLFGST